MSEPQVFVGIDVSKAQLDVALRPTDDPWHVRHDAPGMALMVERLQAIQPALIVVEATGGLAEPGAAAPAAARAPRASVECAGDAAAPVGTEAHGRASPPAACLPADACGQPGAP